MRIDGLEKDVEHFMVSTKNRLGEIKCEIEIMQLNCVDFFEEIEKIMDEEPTSEMDNKCDMLGEKISMIDDTVTCTLDELMGINQWEN